MSYYTYIITNGLSTVLYVGVTNNLEARLLQHRHKETPAFTNRYNINKLVYYETFDRPSDAIAREKQLKGWRRSKKVSLVRDCEPRMEGPERRLVSLELGVFRTSSWGRRDQILRQAHHDRLRGGA